MGAAVAGAPTGKVTPLQPVCLFPTSLEPVAFTSLNPASPLLTSFGGQSSPASRQEAKPSFWASPTPTTKPLVFSGPPPGGPGHREQHPAGSDGQPRKKALGSPGAGNCGGGQDTALVPRVRHPTLCL